MGEPLLQSSPCSSSSQRGGLLRRIFRLSSVTPQQVLDDELLRLAISNGRQRHKAVIYLNEQGNKNGRRRSFKEQGVVDHARVASLGELFTFVCLVTQTETTSILTTFLLSVPSRQETQGENRHSAMFREDKVSERFVSGTIIEINRISFAHRSPSFNRVDVERVSKRSSGPGRRTILPCLIE